MRAGRAGAALAVAGVLVLAACGDGSGEGATATTTTSSTTTTSTTAPPLTVITTTTTAPAPTTTTAPPRTDLRVGDSGPRVEALQARLASLGYWLGPVDATFGDATHHAVVALQKAAGIGRDGIVGPATEAALATGVRPSAVTTAGHAVEVDLDRQLLLVVDDGVVSVILDTSTGRVPGSTPRGTFRVERQIDGLRRSALGLLYRPKYVYRGIAVHGYTSVPAQAASHGCIRVTYAAMDHLWAAGLAPIGTTVVIR